MGIWGDQHVEPLARIARFVHSQGALAGIQLADAGRKASCELPWLGGARLKTPEAGGWTVVAPSPIPFLGIDLIDVSSGALTPKARIPVGKGYQVPFARRIRCEAQIMTGAVGLITEPGYANEIITGGDADLVFIARELLREPYWALKAQAELGEEPSWPIQYGYAVKRRAK